MKRLSLMLTAVLALGLLTGCKQKKQTEDIIVHKTEIPKPQAPIRMEPYNQEKDFKWLDRDYQVNISRTPDDSLRMVKDEFGQKYVDNRITLRIIRADGSIFFERTFTKATFDELLDDDYRQTGILEGVVFDRVDGHQVLFAGSVSHPQTDDEYIPFIITVDNMGEVDIRRDTDLDTSGNESEAIIQE